MSQELGIIEKSPDFINPYRTERDGVSHASMAPSALAPVQIGLFVAAGASHRRGLQEDPEGGREEAEEGGEEERNQERPSHLPLPLGTLAPPLEQVGRAGREEMGAHLQGSVGDPECRP